MSGGARKRRGSMAIAVASGVTVWSNWGFAQQVTPIVDQTFNEAGYAFHDLAAGSTTSGAYVLAPAGNSQLLNWYQGGGTSDLSFVTDPTLYSGNALDNAGTNSHTVSGQFPTPAVLGNQVGDEVTFSFQFVIPNPGSVNSGNDFRFGIFNDNGTPVTAPFSSGYTATNDDFGYSGYLGVGTNFTTVFSETNEGSGILNYDQNYDYRLDSTSTGAPDISDGLVHSVLMTMTNAGAGQVNVALAVDGTTLYSGLDTNPDPTTTFNEIDIWEHSQTLDYRILNVQVDEVSPSVNLTWNNMGASSPTDGQTWDTTSNNWNNGSIATTYADGDQVTFNDTNNGNYAVTLNNTVSPGAVFFNNSSGNYAISGTGKIVSTGSFVMSGAGTTTIGTALTASSVTISNGTLQLAKSATGNGPSATSTVNLSSLSITGNGAFDINNDHVIITYGASDPIAQIAAYIASGYNNGAWNGPGIISSAARNPTNGHLYGVGFADGVDNIVSGLSSGQIEVAYTLLGDANLDGIVNGSDFSILAANFGQGYTNWDQGNFLYTPAVNGTDFSALAANFGQGDSGAAIGVSQADIAALDAFATANGLPSPTFASVPEPASAALLAIAGATILGRRRRSIGR
jgi:hypothetical protein